MAVVTRAGQYALADPATARGAGETSLHNPLRSNLDWQAAIADTAEQAGGMLTEKIEDVVEFIKATTGIDLSGPAALLGIVSSAIGIGPLETMLPKFLGGFDLDVEGNPIMAWIAENVPVAAQFAEAITGLAGGDLAAITRFFDSVRAFFPFDLNDPGFNPDGAALDFIAQVLKPRGVLDATSPIPSRNLFGDIPSRLFRLVPLTSVGDTSPNLLDDPQFQHAASINSVEGWSHDPTVGRSTLGSAKVTADGTLHELLSDPAIPVTAGQVVPLTLYARWAGLVATGTPVRMTVEAHANADGTDFVSSTPIAAVAASGTSAAGLPGWAVLTGTPYTVPPGVAAIRQQAVLTADATAGDVWFDDGDVHKTQRLPQAFTADLPADLDDLFAGAASSVADLFALAEAVAGGPVGSISAAVTAAITRLGALGTGGTVDAAALSNIANIPAIDQGKVTGLSGALGTLTGGVAAAQSTATSVAKNIFDKWFNTTAGTGAPTEVATAVQAIRAAVAGGYTLQTFTVSNGAWPVPPELAAATEAYAGVIGGAGKGATGAGVDNGVSGTTYLGGVGGIGGGYIAEKFDPTTLGATLPIVIGAGASSAGAGGITSIGTLAVSSPGGIGIATPLGYQPAASAPGDGGRGGNVVAETSAGAGTAGTSTAKATGGAGAAGSTGAGTAAAGSAGGTGVTSGLPICGGGGGGGGGGRMMTAAIGTVNGGAGGAGGYPGGGSGGGGAASGGGVTATANAGVGGTAPNGFGFLLWK